jgi:hypothetical protein
MGTLCDGNWSSMEGVLPDPEPQEKVRRPHTAYNLFYIQQLPRFKADFPALPGNGASRELGRRWKSMTREVRKPYTDRAGDIAAQFRLENPDYHYEHKDPARNRRGKGDTFGQTGLSGGPQSEESRVSELLSSVASQMIAHVVLQNADVAQSLFASIQASTLPKLLEGLNGSDQGKSL